MSRQLFVSLGTDACYERWADAPIFTTGQLFLHSCLHFLGLHLRGSTLFRSDEAHILCFAADFVVAQAC